MIVWYDKSECVQSLDVIVWYDKSECIQPLDVLVWYDKSEYIQPLDVLVWYDKSECSQHLVVVLCTFIKHPTVCLLVNTCDMMFNCMDFRYQTPFIQIEYAYI